MAPFKDKHHPSTLSDVGTIPEGPAGVVLEEWRAMRHFHALTRDRGLHVGSGSRAAFPNALAPRSLYQLPSYCTAQLGRGGQSRLCAPAFNFDGSPQHN